MSIIDRNDDRKSVSTSELEAWFKRKLAALTAVSRPHPACWGIQARLPGDKPLFVPEKLARCVLLPNELILFQSCAAALSGSAPASTLDEIAAHAGDIDWLSSSYDPKDAPMRYSSVMPSDFFEHELVELARNRTDLFCEEDCFMLPELVSPLAQARPDVLAERYSRLVSDVSATSKHLGLNCNRLPFDQLQKIMDSFEFSIQGPDPDFVDGSYFDISEDDAYEIAKRACREAWNSESFCEAVETIVDVAYDRHFAKNHPRPADVAWKAEVAAGRHVEDGASRAPKLRGIS